MQSELKPCYLLMKRGLYYAPDRQGYTGVKAKAGRYRAIDGLGLDGVTAIHEDDAAEFSPACWPDTKEAVLRAEITRLTEALRAAEEREKGLLSALEEWMFRYFWRVDGMPVEAARIHAQSRMKIAALAGAKP